MQAKKDTLFSIQNEALKKERKYSLLIMRVTFVMATLIIIPLVFGIFHEEDPQQIVADVFCIVLLCVLLLAMNYLYFLSFLITAVLMMCLEWCAITYGFRLSNIEGQLWMWSMISVIPAWRVRSFLKKQKKKRTDQEVKNTTDDSMLYQSPESFLDK